MTAIVLPDIDKSTIDELMKKLPDLKEIELPSLPKMQQVGKTADQTIDRLLGRSRAPMWPWIAAGIGLVAIVGAVAVYFAFWRRPAWEATDEPWTAGSMSTGDDAGENLGDAIKSTVDSGLTAAEASLTSTGGYSQEA